MLRSWHHSWLPENSEIEDTACSLGLTMCSYLFTVKYYLSLKENPDKSFPPLSDNDKKIERKRNKHCRAEQHEGLISFFRHFEFCEISLTFLTGLNAALKKKGKRNKKNPTQNKTKISKQTNPQKSLSHTAICICFLWALWPAIKQHIPRRLFYQWKPWVTLLPISAEERQRGMQWQPSKTMRSSAAKSPHTRESNRNFSFSLLLRSKFNQLLSY